MKLTVDSIKNLEQKIFPNINFLENGTSNSKDSTDDYPWAFFSPHFYAENPAILTKDLVKKLQNKGELLSLGSGLAYLEQFLVKAYNVPVKNITLCDISADYIPENFDFFKFNMNKEWPQFSKKFDYIIFPESIFFCSVPLEETGDNYKRNASMFTHIMNESLMRLKPDGEIRMKGMTPSLDMIESVINQLQIKTGPLKYKYESGPMLKTYLSVKLNKNNL